MSYNILVADGGGIFGLNTAIVLDRIQKQFPTFLDKIDMIAGTSIGGIIGLGLASGIPTSQIVDLFVNDAKTIFSSTLARKAISLFGLQAYYGSEGRLQVLTNLLGDKTLGQLNKKVVIQSFQLDGDTGWTEKVFHNIPLKKTPNKVHAKIQQPSHDISAVFAGMATSAAPVYFPSENNLLDGGLVANNPSMSALAMTQDQTFDLPEIPIKDIRLLSLGVTYAHSKLDQSNINWGYLHWAKPLIDILLQGNMTVPDYQCKQFLGENYFRVATQLPPTFGGIDSVKDIPALKEFSENIDLSELFNWVKSNMI